MSENVSNFLKTEDGVDIRDVKSVDLNGIQTTVKYNQPPNKLGTPLSTTPPLDIVKDSATFIVQKFLLDNKSDFYLNQQNLRLFNQLGGNVFNPLGIVQSLYGTLDGSTQDNSLINQNERLARKLLYDVTGANAIYTTDGETFGSFVDTIPDKFYKDVNDLTEDYPAKGGTKSLFTNIVKSLVNIGREAIGMKRTASRSIMGQVMLFTEDGAIQTADKNIKNELGSNTDARKVSGIGKNALSLIYGNTVDVTALLNRYFGGQGDKRYRGFWAEDPMGGSDYQRDKIRFKGDNVSVSDYTDRKSQTSTQVIDFDKPKISKGTYLKSVGSAKDYARDNLPDGTLRELAQDSSFNNSNRELSKTVYDNIKNKSVVFDRQPIEVLDKYGLINMRNHMLNSSYGFMSSKELLDSVEGYRDDVVIMKAPTDTIALSDIEKQRYMLIKDSRTGRLVYLDANFESITDDLQPITEDIKVPSPTTLKKITGFNRTIAVSFKMFAKSPKELEMIYKKINYLKYLSSPRAETRFNLLTFTLGNLFVDLNVFITSFSTTFDNSVSTWETDNDFMVPRVIDCNLSMGVFYNSIDISEKSYNSTFHRIPTT